tara:strand:- start:675 stop:1325 length:651 start_codon:yes stop_codon:yes gene_type:complete
MNIEEEEEDIINDNDDDDDEDDIKSNISIDDDEDHDDDEDEDDIIDDDKDDLEDNIDDIDDLEDTDNTNTKKKNFYNNNIIYDDIDPSETYDYLNKFNKEIKKDYISTYHQECLSKNTDEIKALLDVKRDKNNIVIDDLHKTIPILTKYEKTKILGIRIKQLNNGAKPYIKVQENIIDNYIIAMLELKQNKLPFIIQRPIPNNTFEYWKLQDLEII